MALSREAYKAFEAVVGKRNISEDTAICETYRCAAAQSSAHYGPYNHRTPMPAAVLMPGSTEEVQEIIRLCNKYKIHYKASTTFWSSHGFIGYDGCIQLDMRRMKKIIIDPKNKVAIIEPYAIAATVQAEAMKYGLTCNIPGVGCSSSVLANTAGWGGAGPSSVFTGNTVENLLCVEWVLPNGEVAVTGTAGSNDGWFYGEGPGPSVRCILRGAGGTCGEMGVCTRMSIKLSPWPGPKYLPTSGISGIYYAEGLDNFRYYTLCFPSWDDWSGCVMKMNEHNLMYTGHRQFSFFGRDVKAAFLRIITNPDLQLCDLPELMADPEVIKTTETMKIEFHTVIAGLSKRDLEWKEEAIDTILKEFHGWKDEWSLRPEIQKYMLTYFIRLGHKNLNYVHCGAYEGHFGLHRNNQILSARLVEPAAAIKREFENKGPWNAKVGGDSAMGSLGGLGGGGGTMGWEFFASYDAHDKKSVEKTCEYFKGPVQDFRTKNCGVTEMGSGQENSRRPDGYCWTQEDHNRKFAGMPGTNMFAYQWQVREKFNPNHLGSSYYQTCDPEYIKEFKAQQAKK